MMPKTNLLSRPDFRNGTFARDRYQCVVCGLPAVDAHHIIERRLFKAAYEQGGYFLDNGACLCEKHHVEAEKTTLSCQTIRKLAGIQRIVLPAHFLPDLDYDKWGNVLTPAGRLKGELYYEMSVQATLKEFTFLPYFGYSKIAHLPWSKANPEDVLLENDACFEQQEVVIMLLEGGLPFTGYSDFVHGQTIKAKLPSAVEHYLLQKLAVLDADMRVGGYYSADQVYISAVWVENDCLNWEETKELAAFLDIPVPIVLFAGLYNKNVIANAFEKSVHSLKEGYELRLKKGFRVFDLEKSTAQYVC